MNRKGMTQVVGVLVALVIGLILLTFLGGGPLNFLENSFGSIYSAGTCSNGVMEGICETSCDDGYENNPALSCGETKKCCVPQDVPEDVHKKKVLFNEFVTALEYCYQENSEQGCEAAEEKVYELIQRGSDAGLTFQKDGGRTLVRYFSDLGAGAQVSETRASLSFCEGEEITDGEGVITLSFSGSEETGNYRHTGLSRSEDFTGFSFDGSNVFTQSETQVCLE